MAYSDLTATFIYKQLVAWGNMNALAYNDDYLKSNGWADGTKTIFFQAAAPSGWTKDTSNNNKILRVVSGAGGGGGGSNPLSTAIALAHSSHSISTEASHHHQTPIHAHNMMIVAGSVAGGSSNVYITYETTYSHLRATHASGSGTNTYPIIKDNLSIVSQGTTGQAGSHNHGGNTTGSALTDLALAYVDVIVCAKDSSTGYTDMTSQFFHLQRNRYDLLSLLALNDNFLLARLTPVSTVAIFAQAAASIGWTKLTTQDDKALRVVSGSGGGSGGTAALSATITLAHSHSVTSEAGHNHSGDSHHHRFDTMNVSGLNNYAGAVIKNGANRLSITDGAAGSAVSYEMDTDSYNTAPAANASHDHGGVASALTSVVLAYVDAIQCSKNSSGAPSVFTDMSAVFAFKKLLTYQQMSKMSANDAYMKYHTTPASTVMFFFQSAAPLSWTQVVSIDDKAIRIVSGAGAGSGGTLGIADGFPIQHSHVISASAHTHPLASHTHTLNSASESNVGNDTSTYFGVPVAGGIIYGVSGAGNSAKTDTTGSSSGTYDSNSHSHGGATGNALTNITLAYVDLIMCSKDS
jgi:hypothetical protein